MKTTIVFSILQLNAMTAAWVTLGGAVPVNVGSLASQRFQTPRSPRFPSFHTGTSLSSTTDTTNDNANANANANDTMNDNASADDTGDASDGKDLPKNRIDIVRSINLPFSREVAFDAFADLSRQPSFSPWLHSVEFIDGKPGHTRWTMRFIGFNYSWISVSNSSVRPELITWESISGLKNYGKVTFQDADGNNDKSHMTMQMTFVPPRAVSMLFRRSQRVANFVEEKMIRPTLENFRDTVLNVDLKQRQQQSPRQ